MSAKEHDLFLAFVRNSHNYVEFGTGGSTYLASRYVRNSIISVDSSIEWLDKVLSECTEGNVKPNMLHVDIGPIGGWGYPSDPETKFKWPTYYERIWNLDGSKNADLYFVDGRFRVACFAKILLNCKQDALIGFHDFSSRPQYHCVREIAKEIATSEDLSIFQPISGYKHGAELLVRQYGLDPS